MRTRKPTPLTDLLEAWEVGEVDDDHAAENIGACPPTGWHWVSNSEGVVAYFAREADACAFRLMCINNELNKTSTASS